MNSYNLFVNRVEENLCDRVETKFRDIEFRHRLIVSIPKLLIRKLGTANVISLGRDSSLETTRPGRTRTILFEL